MTHRAHREDECAASECSLLCNDYLRLGYQNLVVDPGVRQAYTVRDARDLYQTQWVRLPTNSSPVCNEAWPPLDLADSADVTVRFMNDSS